MRRSWEFKLRYAVETRNDHHHLGWVVIEEIFPQLRRSSEMSPEEQARLTAEYHAVIATNRKAAKEARRVARESG